MEDDNFVVEKPESIEAVSFYITPQTLPALAKKSLFFPEIFHNFLEGLQLGKESKSKRLKVAEKTFKDLFFLGP